MEISCANTRTGQGVLAATTVDLREGEIVHQIMVEASDEYPQGTRSLP
jgi:hypothetical protein